MPDNEEERKSLMRSVAEDADDVDSPAEPHFLQHLPPFVQWIIYLVGIAAVLGLIWMAWHSVARAVFG